MSRFLRGCPPPAAARLRLPAFGVAPAAFFAALAPPPRATGVFFFLGARAAFFLPPPARLVPMVRMLFTAFWVSCI